MTTRSNFKDTKTCIAEFIERECKTKGECILGKYKIKLGNENDYHLMEVNEKGEEITYISCFLLPLGLFHFPEDTFNMIYSSIPWKERLAIRDFMNKPLEQKKIIEFTGVT